MSSRQISWASCADRLLSATGPVSDSQYPMRIGDDVVGMSGTLLSVSSEKLLFPGEGDSAATAMLKNDTCDASGGLARPITLPFAQHCQPGDWDRASLNHTAHGHVVGFYRDTARSVGDDEDVISLGKSLDGWHGEADLGIERGQHELLASAFLHCVSDPRVFPGVDKGAVDRFLIRKDVLKPLDEIAAPFFKYCAEDRRNVEDFSSLGEGDDVVDDHRRLVAV